MNIWTTYKTGWGYPVRYFPLVVAGFGLNLFFSWMILGPVKHMLGDVVGFTVRAERLAEYGVLMDLLKHGGVPFDKLGLHVGMNLLVFLVLHIWLEAGTLYSFVNGYRKPSDFFLKASLNLLKFFRLFLWTLTTHLFFFLLFLLPFMSIIIGNGLERPNEQPMVLSFQLGLLGYLLFAPVIAAIAGYSKVKLIRNPSFWVLPSIFQSIRLVVRHFPRVMGLYYLNLIGIGICVLVGQVLGVLFSSQWVLLLILQQSVFFIRIAARLANTGSIVEAEAILESRRR